MKAYKTILLIFLYLLVPLFSFAIQKNTKEYHKEIEVDLNAIVEIQNQFGDLNISSWDQNKVIIDVLVTVKGNNQKRVDDKLDEIDVHFNLNPQRVLARTYIDENWGFSWFDRSRLSYRVDYTIKLPRSVEVDLDNDYGTIVLNALDGTAKISCDYGKLLIGELNSDNNRLSFDYTSNSSIDFIKGGEIRADFSGFEVEEAGSIDLTADYSRAYFQTIQNLNFKNDYGKLTVHKINKLSGQGDYLTLRVGELFHNLDVNNEFGSLKVDKIAPAAHLVSIQSEYTGIQIGIDPVWDFQYQIDLEFASLRSQVDWNHQIQHIENYEKSYKGFFLDEKSPNTLSISSKFGGVKINTIHP
jgi:hypothetical protein